MISKSLKQHITKEGWKDGSIWEFDWYLDLIFCHAMAYGTNPFGLGYIQPILDDEYINTELNDDIVEKHLSFFQDEKGVLDLIHRQRAVLSDANKLIRALKTDVSNLDLDLYYNAQYNLSLLMASVSAVFDQLIETEINRLAIVHNVETAHLSNHVIDTSSVTALNQSNKELVDLYKTQKSGFDIYFNSNTLTTELQSILGLHKQKYGWINTGERGKHEWEVHDFLTQLKNLLSVNKVEKRDIPPQIKDALKYVVEINTNDNSASDLQIQLDFLFQRHLISRMGENYNERLIEQLSFEEIKLMLQNPIQIRSNNKAAHRLAYPYENSVKILELGENDYKVIRGLLVTTAASANQEIKGRPACQGVVEGYVNIVRNMADLANFKEGNILVAEKTQPSYVMIMKKAKAIVTDIGGITSHAAIVSREFSIPCVVATGNATKILRDGDHISVDAFTGIVKKLKQ